MASGRPVAFVLSFFTTYLLMQAGRDIILNVVIAVTSAAKLHSGYSYQTSSHWAG